ncbi:hypothetical protein NQ317_006597 [Molorchus minor]|uniref:Activin types I and II receptor domain-containing protein n=1 Tax=Molorchus minor TaxID=1323400 RepID=A0ABQ9K0J3_9CUCU|nr:hypothetical protein NQ317_006597 [Molorchus minor]
MAKIVFVFACVALVQIANALQCYHCERDTCAKDVDQWQKTDCKAVSPNEPMCLTYTYKDAGDNKEYTSRKCIAPLKGEKYECKPPTNIKVAGEPIKCETCTTDLCNKNSASTVSLSFVAIAGVVLTVLAPKFYL